MAAPALRLIALATVALAIGCADSDDYARFDIENGAELPDCAADAFPFEPTFLAARTHGDRTGIFLQSSRDVYGRSDMALIQLFDADIPDSGSLELAPASDPDAPRGKMAFFSSCPHQLDTLELRGTVEFDRFAPDEAVVGRLVDGHAVDARSEAIIIDSLSGSWHITVRDGVPYQDFFALPEPSHR